jgi:hypothetical protein
VLLRHLDAPGSELPPENAAVPECRTDLEACFGRVERGAAGYADKLEWIGRAAVDRAKQEARIRLAEPAPASCRERSGSARASRKVRRFGANTRGSLDYANMIPHLLPSGRQLWLAMSRLQWLPDQRIDGVGLPPDAAMNPG